MSKKALNITVLSIVAAVFVIFFYQSGSIKQATGSQDTKTERGEMQTSPFKVATLQFNPTLNERKKNVKELSRVAEKAFENGAKLVVAPEMATTGYMYEDREAIEPFVDTIPGKTTATFAKIAKENHGYIVFGMAEVDEKTGLYYNSAVLIGPDGYIGKYRKTQMWETEMHWAAWGDMGVPVFDTVIGKIAINICMDSAYFETARLAGIKGADIMAFPTNSSAQTISALPARAQQNGMYIVSANRSNTEKGFHMIGGSAVWSPTGEKLAEAPIAMTKEEAIEETVIEYAEIDLKQYENENKERLERRRPELYKELMHKVAPWNSTKTTTSHHVNVAALQYEPVALDKAKNMEKVSHLIEQATRENQSLDLVVLPETSLIGPVDKKSKKDIRSLAETEQGQTKKFMADLATANDIAIVYGFVEKEENKLYNSAMLIDKNGNKAGKYRKTHLNESDKAWAEAGAKLPVFETEDLGRIGILIGEDAAFPETAGVLAVNRADMIAIPSAWHGQYGGKMEINRAISKNPYPDNAMVTWDAVAIGAQAYTVVANFIGTDKDYLGGSGLYTLDPLYGLDQPVVASMGEEEVITAEFDTLQSDRWFNQEKLLQSRQTPYFKPLIIESSSQESNSDLDEAA
ncbi:nitrilase [Halobacillus shinanisalinarum]|uniref:Nitrilase n=1 Tax=Halobacillus shinanisalinarum TaxID=2932258 RepID=A0ABY4GWU3_9BACI|nr:nitrilase-related carbon-nitrogen hydrolase [Halobacillus shinanisalinarum]UOQ92385.1 nitrilase [Halobacillus shinanisalinarum]